MLRQDTELVSLHSKPLCKNMVRAGTGVKPILNHNLSLVTEQLITGATSAKEHISSIATRKRTT